MYFTTSCSESIFLANSIPSTISEASLMKVTLGLILPFTSCKPPANFKENDCQTMSDWVARTQQYKYSYPE